MLKGLAGVTTHEHREWIPILDNDQDMAAAGREGRRRRSASTPTATASCSAATGCTLGEPRVPEAVRHVEIIEFLLESVGRKEAAPWRS